MRRMLILLLLFALPAYGQEIYSGWVDNQGIIPISERTFTILISSNQEFIRIDQIGSTSIDIKKDACKLIDYIRICYNFSQWDSTIKNQRAYLVVLKEPLRIDLARDIDDPVMFAGDKREITVNIENTGTQDIGALRYFDEFPSEILPECRSGCEVVDNSVIWSGTIRDSSALSFSYDITALDQVKRNLKGRAEFFDGFENMTIYSDSIDFSIKHYLNVTPRFSDDEIDLGQKTSFLIFIRNVGDNGRIDVEYFDIFMPKGLELIYHSDTLTKINDTLYRWKGYLADDRPTPKNFTFTVRGVLPGYSNIYIRSNYKYDGVVRTLSKKSIGLISILDQEPRIETSVERYLKDNGYVESFEEISYKVYLENPTNISFYDVIVNTRYPIDDEFRLRVLDPNSYKKIFDQDIIIRDVGKEIKDNVKFTIEYKDKIGTQYTAEHEFKLNIRPVTLLEISHAFSEKDIYGEDEVVVNTRVTNPRNKDIDNIRIYDILPENLYSVGIKEATVDLTRNRKGVNIYSYKVKFPFVNETTLFPFRTYVKYSIDNRSYRYFVEENVSVMLREDLPSLDIGFTADVKKTEVYRGEIMPVSYILENDENQTLWDFRIMLTLSDQYDTISDLTYKIDKMDAFDKLTISDFNFIRIKDIGKVTIKAARLTYRDADGRMYSQRCKNLSIDSNQGYIEGPFISVLKEASNTTVNIDDEFTLRLILTNEGDMAARVRLTDKGNSWDIDVPANSKEYVQYRMRLATDGTHDLEASEYSYDYRDFEFKSLSNAITIEVLSPPPVINITNETEVVIVEIEEIIEVNSSEDIAREPPAFVRILANPIFIYIVLGGLAVFTFGLTWLIFNRKEEEKKEIFDFSSDESPSEIDQKIHKIHDKLKEGKR